MSFFSEPNLNVTNSSSLGLSHKSTFESRLPAQLRQIHHHRRLVEL